MGEETNSIVPSSFVDFDNLKDNEGVVYPYEGQKGVVIQQQWVTLTASMWPEPTEAPRGWKIASERLPLLAAIFCGAAVVVCLLCAFVLYRCCVMPRREKHLYIRKVDGSTNTRTSPPQSQAAIYAQPTGCSWSYNNRIINPIPGSPWYTPRIIGGPQCTQCPGICPVPRSKSSLGNPEVHQGQVRTNTSRKQRPLSQPIHITTNLYSNGEILPRSFPMPEISEFSPHGQQYASSSILDDAKDDGSEEIPTLKTRSLPAWVRNKPRPLSTEDDLNELYAKVNFSKKRKNRMRNDEAAIIALSKSRSQFLHKDTDNLVDNEAVIVYDERTAL